MQHGWMYESFEPIAANQAIEKYMPDPYRFEFREMLRLHPHKPLTHVTTLAKAIWTSIDTDLTGNGYLWEITRHLADPKKYGLPPCGLMTALLNSSRFGYEL